MPKARTLPTAILSVALAAAFITPVRAATLSGTIGSEGVWNTPAPLDVTLDNWVCGKDGRTPDPRLRLDPQGGIAGVVVTVAGVADTPAYAPVADAVIDQKGCVFVPHVLVVAPGQEVLVRNDDGVFHNVRSREGENPPVNKGQPSGVTVRMKFSRPENVRLGCDVHYWMSAVVVVAPHAYTAVTDDSGAFRIDGLSPGSYDLDLWHETLGSVRASATVTESGGRLVFRWPPAAAAE